MPESTRNKYHIPSEGDPPDVPKDLDAVIKQIDKGDISLPPIGSSMEYAGDGDPNAQWMVEDGRQVSRVTYATLFERLGVKYGAGDGVNTFNLPDSRGRVTVGAGNGPGLTARATGQKAGEENHQLSIEELAKHHHVDTVVYTDPGGHQGGDTRIMDNFVAHAFVDITSQDTGNDKPHNNMQPYIVKNHIIRVL